MDTEAADVRVLKTDIQDTVPRGIRIAGAWSWRLLALFGVLAVFIFLIMELRLLVIPLLVALLISSLITPVHRFMVKRGVPKGLSVAVSLLGTIAVVAGLLWLAGNQIAQDSGEVKDRTIASFEAFKVWLRDSPLHIGDADLTAYLQSLMEMIQKDSSALWSGALSVGSTLGHVGTGLLLTLFSLLFFLIDGPGIWRFIVRLFPRRARPAIDGAGRDGWNTLANYARTQILVATIDAVGIGAGAFFLGIPMALPIAVLVFLGSFIPIVGAVLTGAVAVFIALVYNGLWIAVIMLAVVLIVQQVEGHVLQPLLMGSAVKIHPLAVVLVVTGGAMLAGIPGALFAVPVTAVINQMTRYIAGARWKNDPQALAMAAPRVADPDPNPDPVELSGLAAKIAGAVKSGAAARNATEPNPKAATPGTEATPDTPATPRDSDSSPSA
ncbi:AI-2E family transporter [Mycetocola spongiae]|nr:AI-2E family transporter [Mycetocola spongiae]